MSDFQVAGADLFGNIDSGTIRSLSPGPSVVQYPDFFDQKGLVTKDGRVVMSRPDAQLLLRRSRRRQLDPNPL